MLYVIEAGDFAMKIGWADDDVACRLRALQSGNHLDLKVRRIMDWPRRAEWAMHRRFVHLHLRGEWFKADIQILLVRLEDLDLPDSPLGQVSDIIEELGGPTAVSNALSVPTNTVVNWKGRNSIPARYHAGVLRFAGDKLTAERLIEAHAA